MRSNVSWEGDSHNILVPWRWAQDSEHKYASSQRG
jgi:hypothetical protein